MSQLEKPASKVSFTTYCKSELRLRFKKNLFDFNDSNDFYDFYVFYVFYDFPNSLIL